MRKKSTTQQAPQPLGEIDRLGLRVSAMINSPKALLERKVVIYRLDTDTDQAWNGVMELLADTDGIDVAFTDDECVTLSWIGHGGGGVDREGVKWGEEDAAPL